MQILLSSIAFFLLLSVLIVIHELGHFFAARFSKVTVEEFGFGIPPKVMHLFSQGGTAFTLNWIPFGGFVRLKGENAITEKERKAKGSFASASLLGRIIILVAGVFMNFVLAVAILTYGFAWGQWVPSYFELDHLKEARDNGVVTFDFGVAIQEVMAGGTAATAGVPAPSLLTKVNGEEVTDADAVIRLQEGARTVSYTVMTGENFDQEETYRVSLTDGKAGVRIATVPLQLEAVAQPIHIAFGLALRESSIMTVQTVKGISQLFWTLGTSGRVPEGISGIVGIAQLTHKSVQIGLSSYLRLVALLSLSLAVLNILPFPALDGGRLLFVLLEAIRQRPVDRKLELSINAFGFSFLLLLILVITFYDIIRLF